MSAPDAATSSASDATADAAPDTLAADYFDGVSARARRVTLRVVPIDGERALHIEGDGVALNVPLAELRRPERTRHGARIAHLRGGGSLQALDASAWDAWSRAAGLGESLVVAAQQSWRGTLAALLLLIVFAGVGYQWGVPWLARGALTVLPRSVDVAIGDLVLHSLEGNMLLPSSVPEARQQAIRRAFAQAVGRAGPAIADTPYELRFHASPVKGSGTAPASRLGPNAFALPGGTIVVTDEMVALLAGRDDVMIGVLGHELGHARRRHGMRLLAQATLIGTAAGIAWGDFSSVLAAAPAVLGQRAYSRDFEREADADAIALLRSDGLSPAVMAELFERLAAQRRGEADTSGLGIALASHPADAERMARFRDAAQR